ncbi:uncharacterized protein LOC133922010 isoform X2 [Phragmites australis]|uniref:uncharacterized protein LOC133922010 isoform X2 n=1 Tax=Phragmites australis TaxID=29695 RepID=UPI002D79CC1B|nr:uncharacterized protein LOC133922010 isoform X2 [Phragmites australis]
MAEPGKEAAIPPPPLQATETVDGPAAITPDPVQRTSEPAPQEPAAMAEPGGGPAASPDHALHVSESARRLPPQEQSDAAAPAGQPQQTTEGASQPPTPTKAEQVATLTRPPETPSQESSAPAAEAEKQLPAPAPPPQQQKQQQQQEGGVAEEAFSVHEEQKDAAPAQEGEKRPARRWWRRLRCAVLLAFLRPKSAPPRGDQSAPPPEDKGGGTKPSASDSKRPASGQEKKKPKPKDSAAGVPAKPAATEKDEGEGSKSLSRSDETQAASAATPGKPHQPKRRKSRRRAEIQAAAVAGGDVDAAPGETPVGKTTPSQHDVGCPLLKRFQKVGKLVQFLMSWYQRHRSSSRKDEPPGPAPEEGKNGETKTPAPEDKQPDLSAQEEANKAPAKEPHPKWPKEEERLEDILEKAFTKLLVTEYSQLSCIKQKCLLTFSVFELAAEVKKQAMVYWWVSEFNLRHRQSDPPKSGKNSAPVSPAKPSKTRFPEKQLGRKTAAPAGGSDSPAPQGKTADDDCKLDPSAEGIISKLSELGFLEPIKNNFCSRVIQGCKVNPLVHWMLKRRARDDYFAGLDDHGNPTADLQPKSTILCLTAGNRALLHKIAMEDEPQAGNEGEATRGSSCLAFVRKKDSTGLRKQTQEQTRPKQEDIMVTKKKKIILNVGAHVYRLSESLLKQHSDCLVVLQLGQWWNLDNTTYMEAEGLESLMRTVGDLRNLRYLSLRGLSRLTELPDKIKWPKNLAILDMRGCQNLVKVTTNAITPLKQLTHLDLTDCYMLEHIGWGITSLSELRVFKGFVFGAGMQGNKACRLQDLKKLKKLQKLTISVTTDANVGKREMAQLKNLSNLRSLTVTWGELPSILINGSDSKSEDKKKDEKKGEKKDEKKGEKKDEKKDEKKELLDTWTDLELPPELEKLDIRCYPKKTLVLKGPKFLKKLYLRGGELENLDIFDENMIKTLRLRYLRSFKMKWGKLLTTMKNVEYVEIVVKDQKLMKLSRMDKDEKGLAEKKKTREEKEKALEEAREEDHKLVSTIMKQMEIPDSTLDENGVWVRDNKEKENQDASKKGAGDQGTK